MLVFVVPYLKIKCKICLAMFPIEDNYLNRTWRKIKIYALIVQ